MLWFRFSDYIFRNWWEREERSWVEEFEMKDNVKYSDMDKIVISMYYMMTTLSTIGYGDLLPINTSEKWFNILIQILCTTLFALAVSNINSGGDTTNQVRELNEKKLREWFVIITRIRN